MVKDKRLFSEIRKQNKDVHYGYFIQHVLKVLARTIKQEKEIKGVQIRKK